MKKYSIYLHFLGDERGKTRLECEMSGLLFEDEGIFDEIIMAIDDILAKRGVELNDIVGNKIKKIEL